MNVSLPDAMRDYVEEQVRRGDYSTVSELICQDRRRKAQEQLEGLLLEGLESGDASVMEEQDWEDIRATLQKI